MLPKPIRASLKQKRQRETNWNRQLVEEREWRRFLELPQTEAHYIVISCNTKKDNIFTAVENEARESRGHWKHPLDFLFSCISVSVGLGSKYLLYYFKYIALLSQDSNLMDIDSQNFYLNNYFNLHVCLSIRPWFHIALCPKIRSNFFSPITKYQ